MGPALAGDPREHPWLMSSRYVIIFSIKLKKLIGQSQSTSSKLIVEWIYSHIGNPLAIVTLMYYNSITSTCVFMATVVAVEAATCLGYKRFLTRGINTRFTIPFAPTGYALSNVNWAILNREMWYWSNLTMALQIALFSRAVGRTEVSQVIPYFWWQHHGTEETIPFMYKLFRTSGEFPGIVGITPSRLVHLRLYTWFFILSIAPILQRQCLE